MRVLLIAYEFPPSPSPQSLRWAYLSRELAMQGHEVHVLTIDLGGETPGLPLLPGSIVLHRSYAGPIRGLLASFRHLKHKAAKPGEHTDEIDQPANPVRRPRSWKQTTSENLQATASRFIFPDVRGEWHPWGKRMLKQLLEDIRPDVVVSSHEPATTLELGLLAKQQNFPWIADLGDPVLAPYTPKRWKQRAERLERETSARADHLIVTSEAAASLMLERHDRRERISVLTQGFDSRSLSQSKTVLPIFESDRLELLYTGSFYSFRNPDALMQALHAFPKARLSIASVTVPASVLAAAAKMPGQIRLLGFMPHLDAVELQKRAHVLVNIANQDPSQVPGKLYEYLGAGRPILHLFNQSNDAISQLMTRLGSGWKCENSVDGIAAWLEQACSEDLQIAGGQLGGNGKELSAYSWQQIGLRLEKILVDAVSAAR